MKSQHHDPDFAMLRTRLTQALLAMTLTLPTLSSSYAAPQADPELDFMLGQMLIVGFDGLEVSDRDAIVQDIRERHIGGVILFDFHVPERRPVRNVESPEQVRALIASLQAKAQTPLLVAVDQEGGRVMRLKERHGFPAMQSPQQLADQGDLAATAAQAEMTGALLNELGFNLNFAPLADLNTNPDNPVIGRLERSYSADPDVVVAHAAQVVDGHRRHGVLTALKHFPGHGSSTGDSHYGFTDVTETWQPIELEPFAELIRQQRADMVMTAHIFNAELDPEWPATLSPTIMHGLLREQLGFDGLIVSDDMQMGAIRDHYGLETALRQSLLAGVDLFIFGNNMAYEPERTGEIIAMMRRLVEDGTIERSRIEQSWQRICAIKAQRFPGQVTC